MKKLKIAAVLLALAGAYTASASDDSFSGWYVGLGAGYTSIAFPQSTETSGSNTFSTPSFNSSFTTAGLILGHTSEAEENWVTFEELSILGGANSSNKNLNFVVSNTRVPVTYKIKFQGALSASAGVGYRAFDSGLVYAKAVLAGYRIKQEATFTHSSSTYHTSETSNHLYFGLGAGTKFAIDSNIHIGVEGTVLFKKGGERVYNALLSTTYKF